MAREGSVKIIAKNVLIHIVLIIISVEIFFFLEGEVTIFGLSLLQELALTL